MIFIGYNKDIIGLKKKKNGLSIPIEFRFNFKNKYKGIKDIILKEIKNKNYIIEYKNKKYGNKKTKINRQRNNLF